MAAVVDIVSRLGLCTDACHVNQPNRSELSLYKLLFSLLWLFKTDVRKQQDRVLRL